MNSAGASASVHVMRAWYRAAVAMMIHWRGLVIGAAIGGVLTALAALAIATLAGGAVSPAAGAALGLAIAMMAGRLVPVRRAVILGAVAALTAALTIVAAYGGW
jgi:hypothetical protein